MCGIHVSISTRDFRLPNDELKHLLCNRGPDQTGQAQVEIETGRRNLFFHFTSTVLALRGGLVTAQPFVDRESGSVLCWNGEAWKIGSEILDGNDGQKVFDALLRASAARDSALDSTREILEVLRSFFGPFAFVFLDNAHKQLFFGRDRLGRRSLLFSNLDDLSALELSSTADPKNGHWEELEADAIYLICLRDEDAANKVHHSDSKLLLSSVLPLHKYAWETRSGTLKEEQQPSSQYMMEHAHVPSLGVLNRSISHRSNTLDTKSSSVILLRQYLVKSLKLRVLNVPAPPGLGQKQDVRIAVLFSGGLDCTVLARLAHDLLPPEQHIDLINVAFENPRVIRASKIVARSKMQVEKVFEDPCTLEMTDTIASTESSVEISPFECCPDRETGRKTFQELKAVCPDRFWRFIAIDVPYAETISHRANVISLIHPHNTEMDLSIAYALYFAARGTGLAVTSQTTNSSVYTTPARVLLSGLGADELFGGYTRHATAFNRHGFSSLLDELELDVSRLGKRNLGRDDRVISHWGREARFPYLDESLVKWAVECPIWEKCGFQTMMSTQTDVLGIEPGKKVLRLLAHELGMQSAAQEKKRAIQFGARTAKMEVGRTKGTSLIS